MNYEDFCQFATDNFAIDYEGIEMLEGIFECIEKEVELEGDPDMTLEGWSEIAVEILQENFDFLA